MIKRIDHINIVVNDLERAKSFFELLDFEVQDEAELQGSWIGHVVGLDDVNARYVKLGLKGSNMCVELIRYYSPQSEVVPLPGKANEIGIRHIAFEVQDIEESTRVLKSHNVELLSSPQTYPATGKKLVYFRGPEGILLELAEYPD